MKVSIGGTETGFRGIPWLRGLLPGFPVAFIIIIIIIIIISFLHPNIHFYFTGVSRKFVFSQKGSTDIKSSKAAGVDRYIECRTTFGSAGDETSGRTTRQTSLPTICRLRPLISSVVKLMRTLY